MRTPLQTAALGIAAALLAATALPACTDTNRAPIELAPGDEVVFATEVQPYVGLSCGSLDCHGDQGRALRIFAKFGLRQTDELRTLNVVPDEAAANVRALAALADGSPESHIALRKGLAISAGGIAHEGGDIWLDTDAPGYQCLLAFLSGQTNPTACGEALAEVDVAE